MGKRQNVRPKSRGKKAVRKPLDTARQTLRKGKCSKGQQRTATLISYMLQGADYQMEVTWDWLTSGDYVLMYVDIYFPKYNLAVEYHGEQHFKFPNFWHKTEQEFLEGKKRDKMKKQQLLEHGIRFIEWKYAEPFTEQRAFKKILEAGVSEKLIRKPLSSSKASKKLKKVLKILPRHLGVRTF